MRILDPLEKTFPSVGLLNIQDIETMQNMLLDTNSKEFQEEFIAKREDLDQDLHRAKKLGISIMNMSTEESPELAIRKFFRCRKRSSL